jgi:8-oxo-dGTP pyrophosphatase MutT (NUDIX family)
MPYSFNANLRSQLANNLAAFPRNELDSSGHKQAAVALTIIPGEDPSQGASMLLTRRASRLNKHAGQWALPGGRVDDGETTLQGALREMHEEVNLQLDERALIGRLDDLETRSGYIISPFVFWADDISTLRPNPGEVASIHHWPLALFEGDNAIQFIDQDHTEMPLLRLNMGDTRIHAPTGAVLLQLWEVGVHGRHTRVMDYAQPDWAK